MESTSKRSRTAPEEKEMDESDNSEKSSEQLNKEEPAGSPPNNSHTISVNYEPPSTVEMQVMSLYKAVYKGDLEYTKLFIEQNPDLLTAKLSTYGDTALHIAALAGHAEIVKELVNLMPDNKDVTVVNEMGETALSLAAAGGVTKVARSLVRKNHTLLTMQNVYGLIPVVVAAQFGHIEMVHFLYHMTAEEDLNPESNNHQGAKLLTTCIIAQIYDIALDLVQQYPDLAIAVYKDSDESPNKLSTLNTLATRHSAFPSGTWLNFWQHWIYSSLLIGGPFLKGMPIHSGRVTNFRRGIERPTNQDNIIKQAFCQPYGLLWDLLKLMVPAIKHIYDIKLKHVQVLELSTYFCRQVSKLDHSQIISIELHQAIFNAVKHGIVEFVDEILSAYPDVVWFTDDEERNIFLYAILQRQEKIFCLLDKLGPKKNLIASSTDKNGNTMLHHAGILSPSAHLDRISGGALQMQRELQWFKEVEQIVQPMYRELLNNEGKTAHALFTLEHKNLREEGEKWMKDTATSCTVVAALVATVMFAAAFTVPGGYNGSTGVPIYLHRDSFMVFIISDAFSLFSSATSVLMFLGILKSRYTEEEFLVSLPRKLIIGVFTLFFAITTMMLTFGTAIFISLHNRLSWISIPIVLLASVPVMIFVFPQVPLLYEIFNSTYGPSIFDRAKKRWH